MVFSAFKWGHQEPEPKTALERIIRDAQQFSDSARKTGSRNESIYYSIGIVGVVAGFLAGLSATSGSWQAVSGVGGVIAGLAAAVQTFLRRLEKSRFQYDNSAMAAEIALAGRILADRPQPPTEAELVKLAERLTAVRLRPFS